METRFHFHGRSCPPPRGRRVRWEETKDFEIFSSSRLVVFRNEIIKRASEPRFHEGRNWTEEGNTIIFTRLIIRFHVPTSIERQAGRQARTHARTRVFLSSCKALTTNHRLSGFRTKYERDFHSTKDRTPRLGRARECKKWRCLREGLKRGQALEALERGARKPRLFSFNVGN